VRDALLCDFSRDLSEPPHGSAMATEVAPTGFPQALAHKVRPYNRRTFADKGGYGQNPRMPATPCPLFCRACTTSDGSMPPNA
jgi:hypothetical protein